MSALVDAAREFVDDELRRRKRGNAPRLDAKEFFMLRGSIRAVDATRTEGQICHGTLRVARGAQAVELFGYDDTVDEKAATVITDILHAVAAAGYSPQAVLNQAAAYYAEERQKPTDDYALAR